MRIVRWLAGLFAALCGISAGAAGTEPHWLRIGTEHGVVWQAAVVPDERIDLSFVHSQERTVWTQHFRVGADGVLWQDGSTFESVRRRHAERPGAADAPRFERGDPPATGRGAPAQREGRAPDAALSRPRVRG